jgi:hypothetical protein
MTLNSRVLFSYRQEGADAVDQHREAALDLAAGGAGDELAGFQRFLQGQPGSQALGLVARQDGVAVAVFDGVDGHRHEVADLDFDFALVALEFLDRYIGLGLEAGVDHDEAVLDAHDFSGDDFARTHFGALQGFLEQGGKRFRHVVSSSVNRVPGARLPLFLKLGRRLCAGFPRLGC